LAASLAGQGFTGPIDILDEPRLYDPATLLDDLGTRWHIEGTYFKPYSCCRWNHAPIDALLALMSAHSLKASDISGIEVETFGRALTLGNEAAPATLEGAQYSIPFCLGLAAHGGASALLPLRQESLADREAVRLAERVRLTVVPEFDAMFPAAAPGRVRLTTNAGTVEHTILTPKGEPTNPMTWEDIDAKFQTIARERIAPHQATAIRGAIDALREGDIDPLRKALSVERSALNLLPNEVGEVSASSRTEGS
jgi:2-methylcitrate dehydratase PrpD